MSKALPWRVLAVVVVAAGVAEPTLQRSGERRIIIELPGVTDPDAAVEVIGRTAQLAFHPVLGVQASTPGEQPPTTTIAPEQDPRHRPQERHHDRGADHRSGRSLDLPVRRPG